MTKDAIMEANRILNNIKAANVFWTDHHYKNDVPDDLIAKIDITISEYITDMENKLECLSDCFKYEDNEN